MLFPILIGVAGGLVASNVLKRTKGGQKLLWVVDQPLNLIPPYNTWAQKKDREQAVGEDEDTE